MVTIDGFGAEYKSVRDAIRVADVHNKNPYYTNKVDTIRGKSGKVLYRLKLVRYGYEDGEECEDCWTWVTERSVK